MPYAALAECVLALHAAFIAFAALGALLALRWRWIVPVQLAAVAWGALVELARAPCPLTTLENALRERAGLAPYAGDFVARALHAFVYPEWWTPGAARALGLGLLAANLALYAVVAGRRSRSRAIRRPRPR
jgi:uncharacterized protein DUF2784